MAPFARWALGLSLALLSCFLSSLGLTLQRLSALQAEKLHLDTEAAPAPKSCRALWIFGVVLYIVASVPDVLSYVLVPQVVCGAVACFRLVVVTCLACFVLGEKLNKQQLAGMAACTIGTFVCLSFGPVNGDKKAMARKFHHPQVAVYLVVGCILLAVLLAFDHMEVVCRRFQKGAKCRWFTLPLLTGLAFAMSKVFNTEIGFLPMPQNLFEDPLWIGMAAGIAILGLTDFYLNLRATKLMAVQVFIPVSFAWCVTLQYFQSAVLFEELERLSAIRASLSVVGAFLSLLGAILIQAPKVDLARFQRKKGGATDSSDAARGGIDLDSGSHGRLELDDGKARLILEA